MRYEGRPLPPCSEPDGAVPEVMHDTVPRRQAAYRFGHERPRPRNERNANEGGGEASQQVVGFVLHIDQQRVSPVTVFTSGHSLPTGNSWRNCQK